MKSEILHPEVHMAIQTKWHAAVSRSAASNPRRAGIAAQTWHIRLACGALLLLATGCSTFSPAPAVDPAAYAAKGCNELNNEIRAVSTDISRRAITRGRVTQTHIPDWVPGGKDVATAVADRQTARIADLRRQEQALVTARAEACPR